MATGCSDSEAVEVTVDVAEPSASAGLDKTIDCSNPSVTLDGAASGGNGSLGYTYSWEPAADVSDPSIAQPSTELPGAYTLTVTDLANGCTASDEVVIDEDVVVEPRCEPVLRSARLTIGAQLLQHLRPQPKITLT